MIAQTNRQWDRHTEITTKYIDEEDCSQNMKLWWGLFTKYEVIMRTVHKIWSCDEDCSQNIKLLWGSTVHKIWRYDEGCSQNMKLWWDLFTQYEVVMRTVHKIWSYYENCSQNMKLWWELFTKYEVVMRTVYTIWWGLFTLYKVVLRFLRGFCYDFMRYSLYLPSMRYISSPPFNRLSMFRKQPDRTNKNRTFKFAGKFL